MRFVDVFAYLHASSPPKMTRSYQHGAWQSEQGANQGSLSILRQPENLSTNIHSNSNDSRSPKLEKLVRWRASPPPTLYERQPNQLDVSKLVYIYPKQRQPARHHLLLDANKQHSKKENWKHLKSHATDKQLQHLLSHQ